MSRSRSSGPKESGCFLRRETVSSLNRAFSGSRYFMGFSGSNCGMVTTPVMVSPIIIIIKAEVLCILTWIEFVGITWDKAHKAAAPINRY